MTPPTIRNEPLARTSTGPVAGTWNRGRRAASWLLVLSSAAGCATSNHDFDALKDVDDPARVEHLSERLAAEGEAGGLYDLGVVPLAHTHLCVFLESEDEDYPGGFVEADIDAYLPLFGIVDANLKRYDGDHRLYEETEWRSYLWGLLQTHRERIDTTAGLRETHGLRLLWLLDWRSSPEYVATSEEEVSG